MERQFRSTSPGAPARAAFPLAKTGIRAAFASLCIITLLTACVSGSGGQRSPGNGALPVGGLPPHSASAAGASSQSNDSPEGTPSGRTALTHLGVPSMSLGDSALLQPPPDAMRRIDGVPVAILVPLSGRLSGPGQALLEGAQLALFDVGNTDFRLIPLDTTGTAAGAEQAARIAVQKGAKLIVGPLLADSVDAVRPIAEAAGIKVIAFSNSRRVAGDPIYLAGYTPDEQVDTMVADAIAEGRSRFAVLAPSDEFGNVAVDALRDAVLARGAEFSRVGFYDPNSLDFADPIQRISDYAERVKALAEQRKALAALDDQASRQALKRLETLDSWGDPPFDALLVPILSAQKLQIISAQLAYYDVDQPTVRLLGLQQWDSFPNLAAEPGLIGSRYPASRSTYREQFNRRFASLFGHSPSSLSALAYDVTAVAAALAGNGQAAPRYDIDTLTDPQGFVGAEGLFRFTRDGIAQRGFAIMEVQSSGVRQIRDAPTSFEPPSLTPPTS